MNKIRPLPVLVILLFLLSGISSCAQTPGSTPSAWIDYPRDGDTFSPNTPVTIMSHVFARGGVAEVVLSINGEAFRRDVPVETGQDFVSISQDWVTGGAGIYSIQVQVYDREGNAGNPAVISIEVIEGVAPEIPTAVVTASLAPTGVPTLTPTLVPPTLTPTLVPEVPTYTPTSPPPADTTPPPVPAPAVPANGLELTCRSTQTLAWLPVTDPSGIDGYYVKLEKEITAGNWQSAGGYGPVSGKQVEATVDCGIRYRWMVRAQDGAGNYSTWSAPSSFSVTLN
jgi:hypothetical protein